MKVNGQHCEKSTHGIGGWVDLRASLDVPEKRKCLSRVIIQGVGYSAHSLITVQSAVSQLLVQLWRHNNNSCKISLKGSFSGWCLLVCVFHSSHILQPFFKTHNNFVVPSCPSVMGFVLVMLNPLGSATAVDRTNNLHGRHTGII